MIDHEILGTNIPMHDAMAMGEGQRADQLLQVEAHIAHVQCREKSPEVLVFDALHDNAMARSTDRTRFVDDGDDVGMVPEPLENLNLAPDFLYVASIWVKEFEGEALAVLALALVDGGVPTATWCPNAMSI